MRGEDYKQRVIASGIGLLVGSTVMYRGHIVCEVDVIANSLVLYLPFCSTLNKKFFSLLLPIVLLCKVNFSLEVML